LEIRPFRDADWPAVWRMLHATFAAGDSYVFPPDTGEAQARSFWVESPRATFVAIDSGGAVIGTYFIKANQPGLGSHVCNCGYVVAAPARGRGVAAAMCEHSQDQARALGFRAMQFNFVVATNDSAVRLWERSGFAVVGRLPGAFRHQSLGFVDALVMFKPLVGADVVYDPPP
jgi:ribosomal protein S18 acetylase RimI-like enzyme